jgi:hypothetical protein
MLISNLQQFIKLLVPPLTAAGVNKSAETALDKLAAALEPFKDQSVEDLSMILANVQHYRQTGELPEPLFTARTARGARKPSVRKPPKMTFGDAIAKLRELQENAETLDSAQIKAGVSALTPLTVGDLTNVQKEFLGSAVGKNKTEKLQSLENAITTFARSQHRTASILSN